MPSTPVARTNSTRRGMEPVSSAPSGRNGVGTMFQTPRSASMSPTLPPFVRDDAVEATGGGPDAAARRSGLGGRDRRDPARDLDPGIHSELVEDVRDVALDGPLRDEQLRGRLRVGRPFGHEPCNLHLAP